MNRFRHFFEWVDGICNCDDAAYVKAMSKGDRENTFAKVSISNFELNMAYVTMLWFEGRSYAAHLAWNVMNDLKQYYIPSMYFGG